MSLEEVVARLKKWQIYYQKKAASKDTPENMRVTYKGSAMRLLGAQTDVLTGRKSLEYIKLEFTSQLSEDPPEIEEESE